MPSCQLRKNHPFQLANLAAADCTSSMNACLPVLMTVVAGPDGLSSCSRTYLVYVELDAALQS